MSNENLVAVKLRQRLSQTEVVYSRLDGVRVASQESLDTARKEVSAALARQSLDKEVVPILKALQQRSLGRAVGVYETLLSLILRDVLPEEGKVRLIPDYKNNAASLDIVLEKPNGRIEDILEGNGGAVTNILSTGLRFLALARSDNRALLVLDEADCWLKPSRVPPFLKVISQVAANGVQTFFITHHDLTYSEGDINVVEFYTDEISGVPAARLLPPVVRQWQDDAEQGIRQIELINFGPHIHTVIPCFPGATAFIGDNNLGKSFGMNGALRAVGYGLSSDSQINHDADEASVVYTLENNQRLVWTRYRDKSPAVMYRLYEGDNPKPIKESRPPGRNQAPDWVVDLLGIRKIDDLDVQLRSQKTPVFLLDESGARRAKLLAIGKEASYNDVLNSRYEEMKSNDRATISSNEAIVIRMTNRLKSFATLDDLGYKLSELFMDIDNVVTAITRIDSVADSLNAIVLRSEEQAKQAALLSVLRTTPRAPTLLETQVHEQLLAAIDKNLALASLVTPSLPTAPVLHDTVVYEDLLARHDQSIQILDACKDLPALSVAPVLLEVQPLLEMGVKLNKLETANAALAVVKDLPSLPAAPELVSLVQLEELAIRITKGESEIAGIEKDAAAIQESLHEVEREIALLTEELGGVCPLCQSPMSGHSHSAIENHHG